MDSGQRDSETAAARMGQDLGRGTGKEASQELRHRSRAFLHPPWGAPQPLLCAVSLWGQDQGQGQKEGSVNRTGVWLESHLSCSQGEERNKNEGGGGRRLNRETGPHPKAKQDLTTLGGGQHKFEEFSPERLMNE